MKNNRLNNFFEEILNILHKSAQEKALLRAFLKDLLTPRELEEISIRWQIIQLLDQGVPQHVIAKRLGIGVATVTRGSLTLKNESKGFQTALKGDSKNLKK